MISSAHVFVGAAAGVATGNPYLALLAGVASHHLMDMVPHWDVGSFYAPADTPDKLSPRDLIIATVDGLASIAFVYLMVRNFGGNDPWTLVAGSVGGVLPDVWHHIPLWKGWTRRVSQGWLRFHDENHSTVKQSKMFWGVATQLVAVALSWWILTVLR